MEHQELADWLRLLHTPGIGNTSARKLLAAFGLPGTVFSQAPTVLCAIVSPAQALALQSEPEDLAAQLKTTWDWLNADTVARRVLTLGDPLYPQSLLQMEDPPMLLYAMGMSAAWADNLLNTAATSCIAVVGSRNPSPQGAANARQFAQALSEAGLTIVSGMALGVDGAAHEGALDGAAAGMLATVAVVGTGLDRVYPGRHRDLAHRIAQGGVLLSEFPLGTPPLAQNFPMRNRIISGLSRGTLVVEAALQSGSLITARLAAEQGREVFAIPGSIHSAQSRGCHALIKQGAKLVESAQDVLEELNPGSSLASDTGSTEPTAATHDACDTPLLQALGHDPVGLDALQARTGLPTPELLAELMTLELQGLVARRPGGLFQRQVLA
jgi:DNA processing protein